MGAQRVTATPAALALIEQLKAEHGELMFHQSGGCCDGSTPMCFELDEFMVGPSDVRLGEVGGCPFYMSSAQFEVWQRTHLTLDVTLGRAGMFSLEGSSRHRFVIRSRLFTDEELASLAPVFVLQV
jgi:uncharacterized protein (DUF779 family)